MQQTVLILGAAGRLGQQLTHAFANAGWRTLALSRKPLPAALAATSGVAWLKGDALASAQLLHAAQGASVVINALNPPYTEWERLALPLAQAAQDLALRLGALLMLPGNVYNFGNELPALLRPDTPEVGNTGKARIRIAIEASMATSQGLDSVVLRAGDFFGGAQGGSWFDLAIASRLRRGKLIYPGPLDVQHAWAYLPDLARCFVRLAAQREQFRGHRRLHFAGHAIEGQVLLEAMQSICARPIKAGSLPWGLIRLAAPLLPSWRALLEMRYLWQRPHALDDGELRRLIGTPPRTELALALRQSLRELGLGELLRDADLAPA
ncbi:NAD-dependent epimerase/dehydratase family protein [Paucibacter soli]|uniref:NAD-dependent epimerase/dehydratase family protein n=1 Tax=Paucibacter soli TaxID=3133433 RepID=UPI0030AAB36D